VSEPGEGVTVPPSDRPGRGTTEGAPAAPASLELDAELIYAEPTPRSQWQLFRRRFLRHRVAVVSLVVLLGLYVLCFGADWFAPYGMNEQDPGVGVSPPSRDHWFGTDQLGRDQFTRILYAGQISLRIGLAVALIATVVGTAAGALAGYFGRWVDQLLMRITDLFLVVPGIAILAIALRRFGSSTSTIIFVLAGLGWMAVARVVRGQVLSIKEKEFVEAARAAGGSSARIIVRHILPNCVGPIVVNATLGIAAAIVAESTLSFLGFGVQPPDTSWGNMLTKARSYFNFNTHLLWFPGLFILLTVLCVNFIGDGLRDAFDPHSEKK
jgi:peptide/nickel transport system permease protein